MIYMPSMRVEDLPLPGQPMPAPTDVQQMDFYVRLGMAFAAWQFVEATLVNIYSRAVGGGNQIALTASFHIPNGFRIRLDMVNEAIAHSLADAETKDQWKPLYVKLIRRSKKRNELAHGIVIFNTENKNPEKQLIVCSNPSDPSRFEGFTKQGAYLSKKELEDLIISFGEIQVEMHEFSLKLPPVREQLEASA